MLLADSGAFLGNDLLPLLVLAIGGALCVGNVMAVLRPPPPTKAKADDLPRAPLARSLTMAGLGLIAALWALASLIVK